MNVNEIREKYIADMPMEELVKRTYEQKGRERSRLKKRLDKATSNLEKNGGSEKYNQRYDKRHSEQSTSMSKKLKDLAGSLTSFQGKVTSKSFGNKNVDMALSKINAAINDAKKAIEFANNTSLNMAGY